MNKYRFSFEQDGRQGFEVEAPTLELAVKVYGVLYMSEHPMTTDRWVSVYRKDQYTTPWQIRIKVQTTVEYTLETCDPCDPYVQKANSVAKARGLEIGTLVYAEQGPQQGEFVGKVVGYDSDGDPLVKYDLDISAWLALSLRKG